MAGNRPHSHHGLLRSRRFPECHPVAADNSFRNHCFLAVAPCDFDGSFHKMRAVQNIDDAAAGLSKPTAPTGMTVASLTRSTATRATALIPGTRRGSCSTREMPSEKFRGNGQPPLKSSEAVGLICVDFALQGPVRNGIHADRNGLPDAHLPAIGLFNASRYAKRGRIGKFSQARSGPDTIAGLERHGARQTYRASTR